VRGQFNVYCDESCHLEHDGVSVMALGAVWVPAGLSRDIGLRIRDIKRKHGLAHDFEVKWSKVSPGKLDFYMALLDFFLDDDDQHFRGLVVPDKSILDHAKHGQDHDTWYYKMYFRLLNPVLNNENSYRIYLDIKDTLSERKVQKLGEVLSNAQYDFDRSIVERVQQVRSHEVEVLQVTDLLTGALTYANRKLDSSPAKNAIIARIRQRTRRTLVNTTVLGERKLNVLIWHPREGEV
jgi:hypothetical protein